MIWVDKISKVSLSWLWNVFDHLFFIDIALINDQTTKKNRLNDSIKFPSKSWISFRYEIVEQMWSCVVSCTDFVSNGFHKNMKTVIFSEVDFDARNISEWKSNFRLIAFNLGILSNDHEFAFPSTCHFSL